MPSKHKSVISIKLGVMPRVDFLGVETLTDSLGPFFHVGRTPLPPSFGYVTKVRADDRF